VYLIGIVWFALASAACGLASDVMFLIITRVLHGADAASVLRLVTSWTSRKICRSGWRHDL
jgi:MFS family permease